MDAIGIPLLESKLRAPRHRAGLVRRDRLARRIDRRSLPALALVSAPAGFGKTTLVAEWLADDPSAGPVAWLSLDKRDSDPATYWSYVVAALRKLEPNVGADALATLHATPNSFDAAVASLLNDLSALDTDVVLVLDDYHLIESLAVQESMQLLLEHQPAQLHLVVASRADPPWPLAGLRARGELVEIRAADLRFTPDEVTAYLNDAMGLDLARADVDTLEGRTEGWVAALQLAALSLQGRDDSSAFIAAFAGDDRFVVDYLADEVLDRLPEDTRSFLLETSILNRLSAELCTAVTGRSDAKAVLETLDRSNLFLVALDDRRRWYRYHHLFADVLRARLAEDHDDGTPELHRRASAWYHANGDENEAITHAMAGADFERAAELVELAAPVLRRRRQEGTLRRWLEAFPDDIFEDRPVLAITLVGARMASGDTTGVEPLLQTVESSLQPTSQPIVFDEQEFAGLAAQVLVYRSALALLAGDVDTTITHATAALGLVEPTDHLRRGSASALLALAHWTTGDLRTAERLYIEAVSALIAAGHVSDALGCSLALGDIQIAQGRLTDAARNFETGLRLTTEHPGLRGAADMHVGLSEVLIERNDLDAAAHLLETSHELGDSAALPQHAYRWRVTMARLCRARGDIEGALALIEEAAPLFDTDFSPPVRPVAAIRARVQLAHGDLNAAIAWAANSGLTVADDLGYVREYEHITVARVLIARRAAGHNSEDLEDPTPLLDRLLAAAAAGSRNGSAIEILILQATAHHIGGDTPAALAALDEALKRAEPEGHVRLFLHAGPDVTALLRSLAARADAPPHLQTILATAPLASAAPPDLSRNAALIDELSARELDVLRLLRSDLTGPEIAAELVVSINTVRTHTKNIFMKLGVTNRRAAVRRADELGL
jgi:LuxR family maltose regulon positive regulatory protein